MAALTDTRKDILGICNEVRRKLGLKAATTLSDEWGITAVEYLNDVISEVNDYGEWRENFQEILVTASSSVSAYLCNPTFPVHNIREISFTSPVTAQVNVAPLWHTTIQDMRRWGRVNTHGEPRYWVITSADGSTGQPKFRAYPVPGSAQNNGTFNCLVYTKPPLYDAIVDVSAIPPYPSKLLTKGLLAELLMDESRGTDNADYVLARQKFQDALNETYNRLNGDSGGDTYFRPARRAYRKG